MKPRLISFKLCPFVQKAVLALLTKHVEFDIEYIDLENPPQWFLDISPLGKVPVLQIGDQVLFESSVIVEYLDEVYGESLHPADPLQKAQNRSWMEFGNECLMNSFQLITAADEASFNQQRDALIGKLGQLEARIQHEPFFNGTEISLIDLSLTPFFQRLHYIDAVSPGLIDRERNPRLNAWADRLLALEQVADSAVLELPQLYQGFMKKRGGHLATLMT